MWDNLICFFIYYAILSQNLSFKAKVSGTKYKRFKNYKHGSH